MKDLKIVIVDDDRQNLTLMEEMLASRYKVSVSSDPLKGLKLIQETVPDLIILDVDMPEMNGYELCEVLRAEGPTRQTPVIFLTVESRAGSIQKALEVGGSDYLTKPFRMQELFRRIELRLGLTPAEAPLRCGNLLIDSTALSASIDVKGKQETVRLTDKSFKILQLFVKNEGRVLSREQFLDLALGDEDSTDRAIDLHIFRLRKSLKKWDHQIETVYGRGYILSPRKK